MKIFIPRVPPVTSSRELRRLIERLLEQKFHFPFTRRPTIGSCELLRFRDDRGVVEYHGLVSVYPDAAGAWLIAHFKEQRLHGKLLFAREFMERKRQVEGFRPEHDKRRDNLEINKVSSVNPKVDAQDQFRREYGTS
ncbi:hypothetical protein [Sedimenticola hydrogenitrophicus]|uniref:hypothetical protein n=1 Tax=Sedimenticola hydrogenitrophicus TaxID=2967975 RepID=UPI0023B0B3CE|nr:hypothetical protein [Sedimenticola hydrogenitrophicus]